MTAVGETFEFPATLTWLDRPPLRVATGLAGHVVVVLLWRLGCVHSREALAEAARLPSQFEDQPVAVVAVHVPIEAGERDEARLRRTLQLLGVVVSSAVDGDHELTRQLAVAQLPTMLLLDAGGVVRVRGGGVPHRRRLADAVEVLLAEAAHSGRGASTVSVPCLPPAPLSLGPTGVAVDGERIWIAAAAARRVLAVDRSGDVVMSSGSGAFGKDDGESTKASWRLPVGICRHDGQTFVLDALAHTLRVVDAAGDVATWSGNGRRGTDRVGGAYGTDQGLASPMAACSHEGALLVVQAGAHQVWQFDPATRAAMAWLGTGERGGRDGSEPTFCEPTAIVVHEHVAFVADAGGNAVRAVDLSHLHVRTLHRSLPRPMALALHRGDLLVAASWQPAILRCRGVDGVPEPIFTAQHGLVEPVALALDGERLCIADVGADCVFVADLAASPPTLQRLAIAGAPSARVVVGGARLLAAVRMAEHSDVRLTIGLDVDAAAIVEGASCQLDIVDEAAPVLACARSTSLPVHNGEIELLLPMAAAGKGALRLVLRAEVPDGRRRRQCSWRYVVPVEVVAGGPLSLRLNCARS